MHFNSAIMQIQFLPLREMVTVYTLFALITHFVHKDIEFMIPGTTLILLLVILINFFPVLAI